MTQVEAAYIAGIVDGEGTITLMRGSSRTGWRTIRVSIANSDEALLRWIRDIVGFGLVLEKNLKNKTWKRAFEYRLDYRRALPFLEKITPFLRTYKRQRAEMILKDYLRLTPRNGKYTPKMAQDRLQFEADILSMK